jgi:hypothetical protein
LTVAALSLAACGDDDDPSDQSPAPATGANAVPEGNDVGGSVATPQNSADLEPLASQAPFNEGADVDGS